MCDVEINFVKKAVLNVRSGGSDGAGLLDGHDDETEDGADSRRGR